MYKVIVVFYTYYNKKTNKTLLLNSSKIYK